jgi:S-adenosylmethionine decarboxylase
LDALGTHLLIDLKDCDPDSLDDIDYVKKVMTGAADKAGATIVGESFHKFDPVGVTGIVAVAESHLCIHTWPEHGYAAVDIFTCGRGFKPHKAAERIIEGLGCQNPTVKEIQRGLISELSPSPVR